MSRRILLLFAVLLSLAAPVGAEEEAAGPAELKITVVDQTGASLITASVAVTGPSGTPIALTVDPRGQAVIPGLAIGAYTVRVEAEAFQTYEGTITLKKGTNAVTISLPLAGLAEQIVVRTDANDAWGNAFTTSLSEQEIAELPDDPDELEQMLMQMAGPGATMRVNGFRGGRLPPKAQIQSIRFRMNSYAAENHEAGGGFGIDIVTKPGMDGWRGTTNFGFRDETLNARNAFAPTLGSEQYRRFGINIDGPLVKGKTSLAINLDGNANYDSQTIVATTPEGAYNDVVRRPNNRMFASVRLDHQLTQTQQMRVEFRNEMDERENLGVGDFDLPDRAYTRTRTGNTLRFSLNGLLLPKVANELKVQYARDVTETSSFSNDPAIVVLDYFATGGAGQVGDRRGRVLEIEDNIDFQIGKKHRLRAGFLLEGMWYRSDELRNGNGTWTFGSLNQYNLGLAATYTQRTGSTLVNYSQYQGAWYVQDDYTPFKALSVSLGLRHELQSHLDDRWNFAPRVGFTWTPGKYTVRGGYGIFNDWYDANTYEQTLRVNGVTQQEIVVQNPLYPDVTGGSFGTALPPSKYLAAFGLQMPYLHQASIGVERTLFETLRLMTSYTMMRGRNTLRAANINAPVFDGFDWIRPDPSLGNVTRVDSTGRTEIDRLTVNVNYAKPERRFFMGANYQLARSNNFGDGAFALPANSYDPDAEWGPSAQDVRHRFFGMVNFGLPMGLRMGVFGQGQSASPYNIITGFDTNRDTVVNDRPEGVGRNAVRGSATWNLNTRLSKSFGFGPQRQTDGTPRIRGGGGPRGGGPGGGGPMMAMMENSNARYRLEFYLQAFNILNRTNLLGYSGNMRSIYFGQATSASPARRIEVGMNFGF
jgi:Carboxypeptidase regulatory-like domain